MGRIKGLSARLALCLGLVGGLWPVPGHGHSLPSHMQLTKATVAYLQQNWQDSPKLTCSKEDAAHLQNLLLIGTIREDDWFNTSSHGQLGRFVFHFTPKASGGLTSQFIQANCSSYDWGGLASPNEQNKECAFLGPPNLSLYTHTNSHNWRAAIAGAKQKLSDGQVTREIGNNTILKREIPTANVRATEASGAAAGWIAVGYVLHLFQDLTSPAHSNDLAHGHLLGPLQAKDWGVPDPLEADPTGAERTMVWKSFPRQSALIDKLPHELFLELRDEVVQKYPKQSWEAIQTYYRQNFAKDNVRDADPWDAITLPGAGVFIAIGELISTIHGREAFMDVTQKMYQNILAPLAVRYGASFLAHYIKTYQPLLPTSCKFE